MECSASEEDNVINQSCGLNRVKDDGNHIVATYLFDADSELIGADYKQIRALEARVPTSCRVNG